MGALARVAEEWESGLCRLCLQDNTIVAVHVLRVEAGPLPTLALCLQMPCSVTGFRWSWAVVQTSPASASRDASEPQKGAPRAEYAVDYFQRGKPDGHSTAISGAALYLLCCAASPQQGEASLGIPTEVPI
jgi:hypothetical protein